LSNAVAEIVVIVQLLQISELAMGLLGLTSMKQVHVSTVPGTVLSQETARALNVPSVIAVPSAAVYVKGAGRFNKQVWMAVPVDVSV
jgi:hypothetical protein